MARLSDHHLVQLVEGDEKIPSRIVIMDESIGAEIVFSMEEAVQLAKAIRYFLRVDHGGTQ